MLSRFKIDGVALTLTISQHREAGVAEESFYAMANLFPRHTGLPVVVWILVRGHARHDVRVKVTSGLEAQAGDMVIVGLRPDVHVVEGTMDGQDLELLTQWIELNRDALVRYWNEEIDTVDVVSAIRAIG